ncbi:MAG: GTP-binding protein [Lachnospiraceae bacterium]|nr:GTP-binding protein [Lachnospiraceae bacterium]
MGLFKKKRIKIPVILITGYLGSGKTTLLNELLHQEKRKVALVVNDMGEINVDAKLINEESIGNVDTRMVEMSNGCICCTLRDEFMQEVEALSKIEGLQAIFVEASGISEPSSIAEAFLAYEELTEKPGFFISSIVTVVDADRIYTEFLDEINEAAGTAPDEDEDPDIINLVMDQIEFCNTIILNKCDLLTVDKISKVREAIRRIQPEAEIIESIKGKVAAERIISENKFDYEKAMNSSIIQKALKRSEEGGTCDEEYGITSFVFEDKRPFDRDLFTAFIEEEFPEEIIRTKGYAWFADDPVHVQLIETAGRNASITEYSNWVAAFDEADKEDVFANYPEVKDDWDEKYGDRLNQIVFIGRGYSKEAIRATLNKCLLETAV